VSVFVLLMPAPDQRQAPGGQALALMVRGLETLSVARFPSA